MNLSKPPLIEVTLALRWKLERHKDGYLFDPKYQIALGRFQSKIEQAYPHWEKLPMAEAPEQLSAYHPLHRFRASPGSFPMLQLGPGILAVNNTTGYEWDRFEGIVHWAMEQLMKAYSALTLQNLELRYLNSHPLGDYQPLDFLRKRMGVSIELPEGLFSKTSIKPKSSGFQFSVTLENECPKGVVQINFRQGKKNNIPSILWDTAVTTQQELPEFPRGVPEWLREARKVAHSWFSTLTEPDLLKEYQ